MYKYIVLYVLFPIGKHLNLLLDILIHQTILKTVHVFKEKDISSAVLENQLCCKSKDD